MSCIGKLQLKMVKKYMHKANELIVFCSINVNFTCEYMAYSTCLFIFDQGPQYNVNFTCEYLTCNKWKPTSKNKSNQEGKKLLIKSTINKGGRCHIYPFKKKTYP